MIESTPGFIQRKYYVFNFVLQGNSLRSNQKRCKGAKNFSLFKFILEKTIQNKKKVV